MYTILVALDGSERTRRAVDYAVRRATESRCRIELLHVKKPVMVGEIAAIAPIDDVERAREVESRALLDTFASQFDAATGVGKHALTGDPARTILEQAERLGADEIVIGSRGLKPLGAAVLGSVAYKVVHDAKVAVIIAR